jgi:hypothetical protein
MRVSLPREALRKTLERCMDRWEQEPMMEQENSFRYDLWGYQTVLVSVQVNGFIWSELVSLADYEE